MSLKLTMTEYNLHEEAEWLPGEIVSIEETEGGQYGPGLKWIVQLDGESGDTWAFTGQSLTPKARLTRWVRDLDPSNPPEVGQEVDLEKFVGQRVEILFEQEQKDGITKERVTRIRAEKVATGLQKKQAAAARAKKPAPDYGPDEAPF